MATNSSSVHTNCESHNSDYVVYLAYCKNNPHFRTNPVLVHFFEKPLHVSALAAFVKAPTEENLRVLSELFRIHFFNIRFVKYLSSLISYASIDYHRASGKYQTRNQLTFDLPAGSEGDLSLGEFLSAVQQRPDPIQVILTPEQFAESIEHSGLFEAFRKLTERQKRVITLVYAGGWLDSEVASALGVSQQAITKSRISALQKMQNYILRDIERCGSKS
ncbi:sigma-70 family RNA polymerase sigma factor [Paenibacillus xylanexedens]|uniref:sigma-70 family RNA polymerase sigma factor n=1 Tax=Paenibacillus xylanexedens TaxID=528191 RepID=UPI0011A221DD|nr:sigma-70 family RNA polymerase sigma factor [Paenibacillus xylanexedens]